MTCASFLKAFLGLPLQTPRARTCNPSFVSFIGTGPGGSKAGLQGASLSVLFREGPDLSCQTWFSQH